MELFGAWDIFWTKSFNGNLIAPQLKSFGSKKSNARISFGNFLESAAYPVFQIQSGKITVWLAVRLDLNVNEKSSETSNIFSPFAW